MILSIIFDALKGLLFTCFGWINLPALPETLTSAVTSFLDLIFDNVGVLGFIIRPATLKIVIPVVIIIINFDKLYKLTMWILKKIPMLNMK